MMKASVVYNSSSSGFNSGTLSPKSYKPTWEFLKKVGTLGTPGDIYRDHIGVMGGPQ